MAHWSDACKSCPAYDFGRWPICDKPCLRAAQWAFGESLHELWKAIAKESRLYSLVDKLERWVQRRIG